MGGQADGQKYIQQREKVLSLRSNNQEPDFPKMYKGAKKNTKHQWTSFPVKNKELHFHQILTLSTFSPKKKDYTHPMTSFQDQCMHNCKHQHQQISR